MRLCPLNEGMDGAVMCLRPQEGFVEKCRALGYSFSPILFLVFINTLLKEVKQVEIGIQLSNGKIVEGMLFADDFVGSVSLWFRRLHTWDTGLVLTAYLFITEEGESYHKCSTTDMYYRTQGVFDCSRSALQVVKTFLTIVFEVIFRRVA